MKEVDGKEKGKELSEVCRVAKQKNPQENPREERLGNHKSDLVFYARITFRVHFNQLLSLIERCFRSSRVKFLFYFKRRRLSRS